MERRQAYRRTRRRAVGVVVAGLLTFLITDPGSASPAQDAPAFNKGTGSASAIGYKVNPTAGNLSFGITAGESLAGHQNTGATGQSRAINLGVIGVTLARQGCDGGDPTLPEDKQPQPVVARTGEDGAEAGIREEEADLIEKFARATSAPFAEAITSIAPTGDAAGILVTGGRTIASSGVVGGNVREAIARTELGSVVIGGGAVELQGLTWEAIHRSGAVNETIGTFKVGKVLIGGQVTPLPGDALEQMAALADLLEPLGIALTPPEVRVEEGIVFVDPLELGFVQSESRDGLLGPLFSAAQPLRAALTDALLEADCGNASYITVADVALGSVSGAGELTLELGGVQTTTGEINGFQFELAPDLPELGPAPAVPAAPAKPATVPAPKPGAVVPGGTPAGASSSEETATEPISDTVGKRGGLMAAVGAGGLLLLLATAEADRRKMKHALREIPLEA